MLVLTYWEATAYFLACGVFSFVCAPIGVGLFAAFMSWVEERKDNSSSRDHPRAGLKAPHPAGQVQP